MVDEILTAGVWRVKTGNESTFIEAWLAVGDRFRQLPQPPGEGVLIQSVDDPRRFVSFGPWPSLEAVHAMRTDPQSGRLLRGLADLCDEAVPGTFRVVARSRDALTDAERNIRRLS